jgi:hypothetical protein
MNELADEIGYTYHCSRLLPCLIGLYSDLPRGSDDEPAIWIYFNE